MSRARFWQELNFCIFMKFNSERFYLIPKPITIFFPTIDKET